MPPRILTPGRFFNFWYDKHEEHVILKFDVNDNFGDRYSFKCSLTWNPESNGPILYESERILRTTTVKRQAVEHEETKSVNTHNAKSVAQQIVSAWASVMWHKRHAEICKAAMEDRENLDNFEVFRQLQNDYENHKTLANIGLVEFEEMMRPYVNRLISAEITKVQARIRTNIKSPARNEIDFGRDFV
jgi:hypothetical protein